MAYASACCEHPEGTWRFVAGLPQRTPEREAQSPLAKSTRVWCCHDSAEVCGSRGRVPPCAIRAMADQALCRSGPHKMERTVAVDHVGFHHIVALNRRRPDRIRGARIPQGDEVGHAARHRTRACEDN